LIPFKRLSSGWILLKIIKYSYFIKKYLRVNLLLHPILLGILISIIYILRRVWWWWSGSDFPLAANENHSQLGGILELFQSGVYRWRTGPAGGMVAGPDR
tara:strand:- start:363 stop:662 length:300 start_codon:yes stop_codon:yes gene_type:complete